MNDIGYFMLVAGNRVIATNIRTLNDATKMARKLEWIVGKDETYQIVQVIADAYKV